LGKTKNKNRSEIEYVIGENKKLKKEVKQLRRMLEKHSPSQDEEAIDNEDTHPVIKKKICSSCGKGELTIFEIVGKVFETCGLCGDRKKVL
jgi:regulator of replication initiation timing